MGENTTFQIEMEIPNENNSHLTVEEIVNKT